MAGSLALPIALHRVELPDGSNVDVASLETGHGVGGTDVAAWRPHTHGGEVLPTWHWNSVAARAGAGDASSTGHRMERGASVLPHLPRLSTFHKRSVVAGSFTLAITLHGVELPDGSNATWRGWKRGPFGLCGGRQDLAGPRR